jgi:hypothetical protein
VILEWDNNYDTPKKACSMRKAIIFNNLLIFSHLALTCFVTGRDMSYEVDVSVSAEPYLIAGFYTDCVFPVEKEPFKFIIEPNVNTQKLDNIDAEICISDSLNNIVISKKVSIKRNENCFRGELEWAAPQNGMYMACVELDPDDVISERERSNNKARLKVAVITSKRDVNFVWYSSYTRRRWATVITAACTTNVKFEDVQRLEKYQQRGVTGLCYGHGSSYIDGFLKDGRLTKSSDEIEEYFYNYYINTKLPANCAGFGLDEFGGYAMSDQDTMTISVLKALKRAKQKLDKDVKVATWNAGPLTVERAGLYRDATDLLLLESYVMKIIPSELSVDDIYKILDERVYAARSLEILSPAGGCITLHSLDTINFGLEKLGEFEQVIRYIRSSTPEMRGLAFFGVGKPEDVEKAVEDVAFKYFVPPVVTLMDQSLWLERNDENGTYLVVALSNIGAMDAHKVEVEFVDLIKEKSLIKMTTPLIPVGANSQSNRVFLKFPYKPDKGFNKISARIISAPQSTVLNPEVELSFFEH